MELLKIILYRIKNSNIVFCMSFNPFQWRIKPSFIKVPTYADEWLFDPYLLEYKFTFLMIKIYFFIETGNKDVEEYSYEYD